MKVDAACIGNHELDFGIEDMMKVLGPTSKPNGTCQWVMSNLRQKGKNTGVGGLPRTAVFEKGPLRIGILGIVEEEWYSALGDLEEECEFLEEKKTAAELTQKLR